MQRISVAACFCLLMFFGGTAAAVPQDEGAGDPPAAPADDESPDPPADAAADPAAAAADPTGEPPPDEPEDTQQVGQAAVDWQKKQYEMLRDLRRNPETPLLTDEIRKAGEAAERKFRNILTQGASDRDRDSVATLTTVLRYKVYLLADPELQQDPKALENALNSLRRDLQPGGFITNQDELRRFRTLVYSIAMPFVQDLLKQNFQSRSLAMELLAEMETASAGPRSPRTVIYDPVFDVLNSVLNDDAQPDAVKLRAANTIKRILDKADIDPLIEVEYVKAIRRELQNPAKSWVYQLYLVEVLSRTTLAREPVGSPPQAIVLQTFVELMQDRNRTLDVRCHAAAGLGRAAYDGQINFDPLAWKVVQLAVECGFAHRNDPNYPRWRDRAFGLYRAFHQVSSADEGMNNRARRSQLVEPAYQQMIGIVSRILEGRDVPFKALTDADAWLNANKPADLKWDPASPPIQP